MSIVGNIYSGVWTESNVYYRPGATTPQAIMVGYLETEFLSAAQWEGKPYDFSIDCETSFTIWWYYDKYGGPRYNPFQLEHTLWLIDGSVIRANVLASGFLGATPSVPDNVTFTLTYNDSIIDSFTESRGWHDADGDWQICRTGRRITCTLGAFVSSFTCPTLSLPSKARYANLGYNPYYAEQYGYAGFEVYINESTASIIKSDNVITGDAQFFNM
jgi:hypothetical protein